MNRSAAFIWKALVGTALCLTPLTAILVLGWTSRAVQRRVFQEWHAQTVVEDERRPFAAVARGTYATRRLAHWPNWLVSEDVRQRLADSREAGAGVLRRCFVFVVSLFGALWSNLRAGFQMLTATWVVTAPVMVLMLLSWWGGWENSFNKGYEQAWVGPGLGIVAVLAFIAVMTYVPLAQARLAVSGTWRSFFDYRLIRLLAASNPFAMLRLVFAYAFAGFVLALLRAAPLAIGNFSATITALPEQQLAAFKLAYAVVCAAAVLALLVPLRLTAAKVYGRAVLKAMRTGRLKADRLSGPEREFLAALRLLEPEPKEAGNIVARAAVSTARGFSRLIAVIPALILWFVFVALIYIAQFFNHDWTAWMNHPAVQLPWMLPVSL